MLKRNHTRLCAGAAIAAALALPATPLFAQGAPAPTTVEPAPVLTIPTTPPPAPVQPTIVLPTELPETAPPPASVTTPERTAAPTTTRTERAAAPATPPASRVRAAAPADPVPAPVVEEVEPLAAVPVVETTTEPVAPPAASEPVAAEPAPADNDNSLMFGATVLAAIAALVLAIWGFIAIGRRRPVDRKAAAMIERPVVAPREPVAQPVIAEPVPTVAPSVSQLRPAAPAPSMMHSGAAVPLPRTMPTEFAERDALIKRMVAAKPDRANPFKSPIQRLHRAKLILQSLGTDFSDREPWIDLSQYPQNWPELAARKHAAA